MNTYTLHNTLIYNNSVNYLSQQSIYDSNSYEVIHSMSNLADQDGERLDLSFSRELLIPLSILENNSSLEAIVLYLKDFLKMRFNQISVLLNRDQRTIWVTYSNAKKKGLTIDTRNDSRLFIPLDAISSRSLSVLESIVVYLRTNHALSFNQVSDLLGKNYRTIWTVYKRALKKLAVG
jgi:predicted DNA-binding protein (UPF0251 family)